MTYRCEVVPVSAFYIHNNGDKDPVHILGNDNSNRCWVRWDDGFINLVSVSRLEIDHKCDRNDTSAV
jgi:hypothetical protein